MEAASIVPAPRYCRRSSGEVDPGTLSRLLVGKGASKRRSAALSRNLAGEGSGVKTQPSAGPRLSFTILAKGAKAPKPPVAPRRPEGYALEAGPEGISAAAADEAGLYWASVTAAAILEGGRGCGAVGIVDWPVTAIRGLHLDLKGFMPTFDALLAMVDEVSRMKMNCLLVEYEDKIIYDSHPVLAAPTALTKAQVRKFVKYCRERYVEVMPLLQALGHAEYILKHPEYEELAEDRRKLQQLCPSKKKTLKLFRETAAELAELHPGELFHIGSDETWQLGRCSECAGRAGDIGKEGVFIEHTSAAIKAVKKLGKRAVLWDDMLRRMPDEQVSRLDSDAVLMYWIYRVPGGDTLGRKLPQLERYRALGFDVIGASATKGADGPASNMPDFTRRFDNIDLWGNAAETGELAGVVATAWSRYNSFRVQCDIPETQYFPLCYSAERSWNGRARPRAEFERRYGEWAFGLGHAGSAIAAAHHSMNRGGRSASAWALELCVADARRGRDALKILATIGRLDDHIEARQRASEEFELWMPQITGPVPMSAFAELRSTLARLDGGAKHLRIGLSKLLARSLCDDEIEEFIESRLGPTDRLVARANELLR